MVFFLLLKLNLQNIYTSEFKCDEVCELCGARISICIIFVSIYVLI